MGRVELLLFVNQCCKKCFFLHPNTCGTSADTEHSYQHSYQHRPRSRR